MTGRLREIKEHPLFRRVKLSHLVACPNSAPRIVNVSCPVLFIHGASDSLIPVEHSKTLFGLCRSRKLLVTPPKMDHNSSMFSDPPLGPHFVHSSLWSICFEPKVLGTISHVGCQAWKNQFEQQLATKPAVYSGLVVLVALLLWRGVHTGHMDCGIANPVARKFRGQWFA